MRRARTAVLALAVLSLINAVSEAAVLQKVERTLIAPRFVGGTPHTTHITDTSLHIEFQLDKQGFFYFVIQNAGEPEPTPKAVKLFLGGQYVDRPWLRAPVVNYGWQQVTTTTRVFRLIVFEFLELDTPYDIWCVTEDNWQPEEDRIMMDRAKLVQFRTQSGRVKVKWEPQLAFRNGYNVLGVGTSSTHNHNTPTLIPAYNNVTVVSHDQGRFYSLDLNTPNRSVLEIGDIWHGRLTISAENDNQPMRDKSHISSGGYHWLAAMYDRRCLSLGHNSNGRLGLGDTVPHLTATAIPGYTNVTEASAGLEYSLILDSGKVYSFGRNDRGQLGLGDLDERWTPTLIASNTTSVEHISAGRDHFLFTNDGQLYAAGSNKFGQLGIGNNEDRLTPVPVPGYTDVKMVLAGNYHSVIVNGSRLFSFGYNFRSGGEFYGYSPTSAKCYQHHAEGCLPEY